MTVHLEEVCCSRILDLTVSYFHEQKDTYQSGRISPAGLNQEEVITWE